MDRATPNLPSRDFDATSAFFGRFGFVETFRDAGWMILARDGVELEFFPHPELRPEDSWHSACIRLSDPGPFLDAVRAAGVPEAERGLPRLHPAAPGDVVAGALVDPDGSLLRVLRG